MERLLNLAAAEEAIDNKIAEVLQSLLVHFQKQRDALVAEARLASRSGCSVTFEYSCLFQFAVNNLMTMSMGKIVDPMNGTSDINNEVVVVLRPPPPPVVLPPLLNVAEESHEERMRKRLRFDDATPVNYDNLQVLACFQGTDCFGEPVSKPANVVAVQDLCMFAVSNEHSINVFTADGVLQSTVRVVGQVGNYFDNQFTPSLAVDIFTNRLYSTVTGTVHGIDINYAAVGQQFANVSTVFLELDNRVQPHRGLAVSPLTRQIYTAEGNKFVAFSLHQNICLGKVPLGYETKKLSTCHFHRDRLYFKTSNGHRINYAPIDPSSGNVLVYESRQIGDHPLITGVAFDHLGNLLLSRKGAGNAIAICSPVSHDVVKTYRCLPNFNPSDLSVLSAPIGSEFFSFNAGEIRCPNVLAMPDYNRGQIIFMGCPVDFT